MVSSNNGGDNSSFEENASYPTAASSAVPPLAHVLGGHNDLALALYLIALPAVVNPLFCEQFYQFIVETIKSAFLGPLATRAEQSS
ncbi:UNVERIFIED_CONTAM: hypothetical protein Sradi_1582800 [Sesamum radiatum]|uniref:Uncharacterized protein n=1 Tax=Sesamum radiatum TaxID=300843 RepID=A0AAW2U8Y0_SESRA